MDIVRNLMTQAEVYITYQLAVIVGVAIIGGLLSHFVWAWQARNELKSRRDFLRECILRKLDERINDG